MSKPKKPKFRVGQVVRLGGGFHKVESWHFGPEGEIRYRFMWEPEYSAHEKVLRPLTKRERGPDA